MPQALRLHLSMPGQELAPGVVDTTWKQGAADGNSMDLAHAHSHAQPVSGLQAEPSLGEARALKHRVEGLLQPKDTFRTLLTAGAKVCPL